MSKTSASIAKIKGRDQTEDIKEMLFDVRQKKDKYKATPEWRLVIIKYTCCASWAKEIELYCYNITRAPS